MFDISKHLIPPEMPFETIISNISKKFSIELKNATNSIGQSLQKYILSFFDPPTRNVMH
jgi:hypothetical protein